MTDIDYEVAHGIACVELAKAKAEIDRLQNQVSDLEGLIKAYRKWAAECPILEKR